MEMLDAAAGSTGAACWAPAGSAAIPRWTRDPAPGVAEHLDPVPDELRAALAGPGLLAAHATVLAALTGEPEVDDRLRRRAGRAAAAVPARHGGRHVAGAGGRARRAEAVLSAHRDFPVESLRRELGLPGPLFETVLDPAGTATATGDAAAVGGRRRRDGRPRCGCATGPTCSTREAAARIAGYHLRARSR